jgi:hypothetical protein
MHHQRFDLYRSRLEEAEGKDTPWFRTLRKEYDNLRQKWGLNPVRMEDSTDLDKMELLIILDEAKGKDAENEVEVDRDSVDIDEEAYIREG